MAKESQPSIELKSRKTLLTNFTYVYSRQINTLIVKFRRQTIVEFLPVLTYASLGWEFLIPEFHAFTY